MGSVFTGLAASFALGSFTYDPDGGYLLPCALVGLLAGVAVFLYDYANELDDSSN